METTESRFAHLLQPIRELAKNWDVDLASELKDYLDELDTMCISFDGGKTRLNFAEAALLIQGSTCIYSKKVELLHCLVYQTLEFINDKNKRKNKQTGSSEEDRVPESAGGYDQDDDDDATVFRPWDCDPLEDSEETDQNKAVKVTGLPPVSLIPPESHDKQKMLLISMKGEVTCSLKDSIINQFLPGEQGIICLTQESVTSCYMVNYLQQHREPLECGISGEEDALRGDDTVMQDFLPMEDNGLDHNQDPVERVLRNQGPADSGRLKDRQLICRGAPDEEAPAHVNAWTLQDPFISVGDENPLQPGKCSRVPDGLDDGGKRKRRRDTPLQDFRTWFQGTFKAPQHKMKNGPYFSDLNYIYMKTMREKLRSRRRICLQAGVMVSEMELRKTFLQAEKAEPPQQEEELGDHPLDGGGDLSDGEDDTFPHDGPDFIEEAGFQCADAPTDDLSYEDLVKLRVEQLVVTSRGYTQETALSQRVKDWEEKIKPELLLQEERLAFDIHDYEDRIVSELNNVGDQRSFSSIVHGMDNFEACKFLLAALQLANDSTVYVDSVDGLEASLDSMSLTLLSTQRATERFKTLAASR